MPKLTDKLKNAKPQPTKAAGPVWEGPSGTGPNGGITFSLLSRFLVCRERFRLKVCEGLSPAEGFRQQLEYGNMWHTCEEALAGRKNWVDALQVYCQGLGRQHPIDQTQINHWYRVCRTQFPIYIEYWAKHPDVVDRQPLFQEHKFDVPYPLPSGRKVRLRGKWDSVDLIGKAKKARVFLQENKSKGDIDEFTLQNQLQADLQTSIYMLSLNQYMREAKAGDPLFPKDYGPLAGIRYNVIRRPLSGGKHSIRQHQPTKAKPMGETPDEFYARLGGLIEEDSDYFFKRWCAEFTQADMQRIEQRILMPILEQLCDWWEYMRLVEFDPWNKEQPCSNTRHWQHPYGVYNVLNEGGHSELDEHIATGSTIGLQRVTNLFPELT